MKIHSLALVFVLAMNSSFASAQSSGMGISVLPPGAQTKPKVEESTTTGSATRSESPTNELKANRVKKTTGNRGIQSGPDK